MAFLGRTQELDRLVSVLDARGTDGRVLVVRGAPGTGRTALLDAAIATLDGRRVTRVAGSAAERDLPYAGLHTLLTPFLDGLDGLPAPQAAALRCAFGLGSAPAPPNRFLAALGCLTLLADAALRTPVVCVCDDAQWLDPESLEALAFVARRLDAEDVTMVFAVLDDDVPAAAALDGLDGLPTLTLHPLDAPAARALLESRLAGPVDEDVARRVLAEAAGNPLAVVELTSELQRSGGHVPLDAHAPVGRRPEDVCLRRWSGLAPPVRDLLVVAAADATGDPDLVRAAGERLGVVAPGTPLGEVLAPATAVGLVDAWPTVAFRHPLARSAVLRGAPADRRRAAHAALGAVTDPVTAPDRRVWHLAAAAVAPDDPLAGQLAAAAARAGDRGGLSARAAFLARAGELSSRPDQRARHLLAAGQAAVDAGQPVRARELLDRIVRTDGVGEVALLRADATVRTALGRSDEALRPLLHAADALTTSDPLLARDTLLDAFTAVVVMPWLPAAPTPADVGKVALRTPRTADGGPRDLPDVLLDGLALRVVDGYEAAAPVLHDAVQRALASGPQDATGRWYALLAMAADDLWMVDDLRRLAQRTADGARRSGRLDALRLAEHTLGSAAVWRGDLDAADGHLTTARELWRLVTGSAWSAAPSDALLQAWRGDTERVLDALAGLVAPPRPGAEGGLLVQRARTALGVLHLGHGRYADALAALRPLLDDDPPCHGSRCLADVVEAGVRTGRRGVAGTALARLRTRAVASGSPWAAGVLARAEALAADDDAAEARYRTSLDVLAPTGQVPDLARSHLVLGEWLRRRRRRAEAGRHLTLALEAFDAMGAHAFASRARDELAATGLAVARPRAVGRQVLTSQEAHIAELAAAGLTNRDIASQLFLSPTTVDYHLRKVFRKLGVTSRRQLPRRP